MQANLHLSEGQLKAIKAVLKRHIPSGFMVFAFGSRVHGRNIKSFSDFDLCVRGQTALPDDVLAILKDELADSDIAIRVDLVDWHDISDEFRNAIARDLVRVV